MRVQREAGPGACPALKERVWWKRPNSSPPHAPPKKPKGNRWGWRKQLAPQNEGLEEADLESTGLPSGLQQGFKARSEPGHIPGTARAQAVQEGEPADKRREGIGLQRSYGLRPGQERRLQEKLTAPAIAVARPAGLRPAHQRPSPFQAYQATLSTQDFRHTQQHSTRKGCFRQAAGICIMYAESLHNKGEEMGSQTPGEVGEEP